MTGVEGVANNGSMGREQSRPTYCAKLAYETLCLGTSLSHAHSL